VRALLLAAGLGTRLRPVTDTVPKCLVEIDGRPLLDYWIELLYRGGIPEMLINLHYLADKVEAYLRECRWPVEISTVFEPSLLGTGGTLLANRAYFGGGPAMLVHADNLSRFDVRAFIARHAAQPAGVEITMMTFETGEPKNCGIVEVDSHGVVQAFHEKVPDPPGRLANGAVYIVSPAVMDFLAELGKPVIDFSTEVVPHFLGRIGTFHNAVYHRDIGSPASLEAAQREYSQPRRSAPPSLG
jgi:mannose-1-phosphate guanylyltransferase